MFPQCCRKTVVPYSLKKTHNTKSRTDEVPSPSEWLVEPSISLRKGFLLNDLHSPLYDMIKKSQCLKPTNDIYIYRGGGVWVQLLEGQGTRVRVILVLREYIWNAPAVSLVLPAFDYTAYLGSPPHQLGHPPGSVVPHWVTASCFLAGNKEAELKPTTFSSLLVFRVFLSFFSPDLSAI